MHFDARDFSMPSRSVSTGFLRPFGSFAPMVSGSGGFGSIRCILTISCTFSVVSVSFPMVYVSVHVLDMLRWFLDLSAVSTWLLSPLVGSFDHFDSIGGILKVSGSLQSYSCSFPRLGHLSVCSMGPCSS